MFGIAKIETPKGRKRYGKTYDCGKLGMLTVRQIASVTGMSPKGAWNRVSAGYRGEALVIPKHETKRVVRQPCKSPTIAVAMKLVKKFPSRVPSVVDIQRTHPMGKRQAQRWRQAMADAKKSFGGDYV